MADIDAALAECVEAQADGGVISDGCARTIAASYHSGNLGASFSTTGAIESPDLVWHELFNEPAGFYDRMPEIDKPLADALGAYLHNAGTRGPVDGWSRLWVR